MKSGSRNPASFRDPAGYVFEKDGEIFRAVAPIGLADYREFQASGLASELQENGRLVAFTEAGRRDDELILELSPLPFISYPYEWCFSQLRAAAVLTLDVELAALERGLSLKDGSAFNVGWYGGAPIFMDHGSFTVHQDGSPWAGYRQFVMHFLGPLLLAKYSDVRHLLQLRNFPDGLPLDYIAGALPFHTRFRLYPLLHLHLHARLEKRYAYRLENPAPLRPLPRRKLWNMLHCLRDYLRNLTAPDFSSEWKEYYAEHNYSPAAFEFKQQQLEAFCREVAPGTVVDFGCNTGEFSGIAARSAGLVIAADVDPMAVEGLFLSQQGDRESRIYPVWQDLNNPSPGIGIFNRERKSFLSRCRGDLALGLALMHHLRIGGNWPLPEIVRLFAETAPTALVEFVPKQDSQVRRLLASRPDICDDWELAAVRRAFEESYSRCEVLPIPESERYLLKLSGGRL